MRYPGERIALFIDGPNLSETARALDLKIDYQRLFTEFKTAAAYYYTALYPSGDGSNSRLFMHHLQRCGFTLVTKPIKIFIQDDGSRKVKGNMDVEIAVDIITAASSGDFDRIVLFSGDGDFRYLVEKVQTENVAVTVVSSVMTEPPGVATALRFRANEFLDLDDLRGEIEPLKTLAFM
jgi:uncharacterized LabA/DUF88 family protein